MSRQGAALVVVLALLGLVASAGIGLLANTVSGDSIGLAAAPLSAGRQLAPPEARKDHGRGRDHPEDDDRRHHDDRSHGGGDDDAAPATAATTTPTTTTTAPPATTTTPTFVEPGDDNGGEFESGGDSGSSNSGSGSSSSGSGSSGSDD
jgi:hypothetical protein